MDCVSRVVGRVAGVLCVIGLLGLVVTARAGGQSAVPPRGSVAPAFALESVRGERVELAQFAERPVVLIFGDLRHEGAKKASREVLGVLADDRLAGRGIVPIFITAQRSTAGETERLVSAGRFPALVLRDEGRAAFGAYRVLVVPSVVVIDGEGVVVHAMPGFLPRFVDLLTESLLVSTGQMTDEAFEASIDLDNGTADNDPDAVRADRLVRLGEKLLEHGMSEMAEARFREALAVAPGHEAARLAMGDLCRRAGDLEEAEAQYRAILGENAGSIVGALGLARVQIDLGGDALGEAEGTIRGVLELHPGTARAHYQLGLVLETGGDLSAAAAAYRAAAELLLEQ